MSETKVTVAFGDGVGPEIMEATLEVLEAAGARLALDPVAIGERAYRAGHASGIPPEAWATRVNPRSSAPSRTESASSVLPE